MICIIGAFFLANIGRQALQLIIQYASKRFSWSFARASLLTTLKGIINLMVLLVLLFRISLLPSKHMSAAKKPMYCPIEDLDPCAGNHPYGYC